MEIPYLFHCLPVRLLLACLQVYLLGFLSLGGTAIDAWYAAHPATPHPLKLPQLRVAAGANASSLPGVPPVPPLLLDAPGPTIRRQVFSPVPPAPGAALASAPAGKDVILLPELPFAPPAWPFQRSTSAGPEPSPISPSTAPLGAFQRSTPTGPEPIPTSPSAAPRSAFSALPSASPPPPRQPVLPPTTVTSANARVSHSATPPSTPAECDRLDAELTGLRCFEAADAATRDRCRRLAACHPLQPDPVDVQRVLPPVTQPCVNNLRYQPRVRSRALDIPWRCTPRATAKFFYESLLSNHLDGRWGRLPLPPAQRQEELGKLFQAWSAFTAERGLQSWLFAGSLIGWFFNKEVLPWDDDLDVQVLASHLRSDAHYLKYDRTTFQNRYYFEINPNSASRALDWNNIIDARFIDKSTGVFIDIVAVSFDPVERTLKCKRQEPFNPAVLFPLRRTTFMGAPAWVPRDPGQALIAKYGGNVVLHQQPQRHHTAHCPAVGPCAVYAFDPATLRWVYQPPSPGLRRPTGFPLVRPATWLPPQPSPPLTGLARLHWLFQNPL